MMLVLCPSNSPVHTYMGPLSFTGGVAFPLHHGGVFALKGSAPSRVNYLARTYYCANGLNLSNQIGNYLVNLVYLVIKSFDKYLNRIGNSVAFIER